MNESLITTENAIKAYEADWDESVILEIMGKEPSENIDDYAEEIEELTYKLDEAYLDYIQEL